MNRYWILVFISGLFEIGWVTGLKHADNEWEWLGTLIAIYASFAGLIRASAKLPVGTVYTVFTGIGTAGTVIVEMAVFGEPFRWIKALLILLIMCGVVGLKMSTKESDGKGAGS